MNGRNLALDNVFIERLLRSVKYEDIHLKEYESADECLKELTSYFKFYTHEQPHQFCDDAEDHLFVHDPQHTIETFRRSTLAGHKNGPNIEGHFKLHISHRCRNIYNTGDQCRSTLLPVRFTNVRNCSDHSIW